MRTYGQYCGIARALDLIGDRWTLLIARELLLRGPSRYSDLQRGLPGIATNLLAGRLRDLEEHGLVERLAPAPPLSTDLFQLTDRGRALDAVLAAIGRWAAPLMVEPSRGEAFRSHWLRFPLELHLADHVPNGPQLSVELRTGDEPMTIRTAGDGSVRVAPGAPTDPDAILAGAPDIVVGLLLGRLTLAQARVREASYRGDPAILTRLRARPPIAE